MMTTHIPMTKPPLIRIIDDCKGPWCPGCGSSAKYQYEWFLFNFGKRLGCIQDKCDNYWNVPSTREILIRESLSELKEL
jgi:hypothetical protein